MFQTLIRSLTARIDARLLFIRKRARTGPQRGRFRSRPVVLEMEIRRLLSLTTLASFNNSNGVGPTAGVIMDSSGNLYGTTFGGGSSNDGTIFEVANGKITTMAAFDASTGAEPTAGLIMDSDGNLYGTTSAGGSSADGTIFELAKGSRNITTLASFIGTNGGDPTTGLIMDSSGNLYGTTAAGGSSDDGVIFELASGSHTIIARASLSSTDGGDQLSVLTMDSNGNLYGTTKFGGPSDDGTIFELAPGSKTIATLASFNGTNGSENLGFSGSLSPNGVIVDSSGNLYGAAPYGGASAAGTVFTLANDSHTITPLASFDGTFGAGTSGGGPSGVIIDGNGNLFGTSNYGGAAGEGTVFEWSKVSGTITPLGAFRTSNGAHPEGGVIMDTSGNLYGTTPSQVLTGGALSGTVFELSATIPTQVALTVEPPAVVGLNTPFEVKATAEDANGNPVPNFSGPVTIGLDPMQSGVLGGTLTVSAVNGVADFPDLSVNMVGAGYRLKATADGLSSMDTTPFTVALTPDQIRTAYGLPPIENLSASWSGSGETIAIIGFGDDPMIGSDLAAFDNAFNLPSPAYFLKMNSSGQPSDLPSPVSVDFENEEAMDVEWAHAIAPAASIILVEASYPNLGDLLGVPDFIKAFKTASDQPGVSVVSTSFTVYDTNPVITELISEWSSLYDNILENSQGVTFVTGSGDQGNTDSFPAIVPDVLSVGGTYLTINSDDSYKSEQYWNVSATSQGKSGGYGVTSFETEPSYQESVQNSGNRAFPDVSFDASSDSAVLTYTSAESSAWFPNWGTSLAAPCWAGLLAIANQQRVSNGKAVFNSGIGDKAVSAIYDLPTKDFNLINGARYTDGTGLGTPKANLLVPALAAWNPLNVSPGSIQDATVGAAYKETISASGGDSASNLIVTPLWIAYPLGLTFDNSESNVLSITGTPTLAGSYSFTITATDSSGITATQSYTLIVNPKDVTRQVKATSSRLVYNRATKQLSDTITLTNKGATALTGSLDVVLTGLPHGVSLANASGHTVDGDPIIRVDLANKLVRMGHSVKVTVRVDEPKRKVFKFRLTILEA
jgi:uncharacterized repeat protein (TIGR03803 family)